MDRFYRTNSLPRSRVSNLLLLATNPPGDGPSKSAIISILTDIVEWQVGWKSSNHRGLKHHPPLTPGSTDMIKFNHKQSHHSKHCMWPTSPDLRISFHLPMLHVVPNMMSPYITYLPTANSDPTSNRLANAINHQGTYHRDEHRDVIMPNTSVLRKMPHVSASVSEIMATYEAQARTLASQGKPATSRHSGHYNTVDAIISEPKKCWPNEGLHRGQGKKRPTSDELSLPQWVAAQLANICNILDHTSLSGLAPGDALNAGRHFVTMGSHVQCICILHA